MLVYLGHNRPKKEEGGWLVAAHRDNIMLTNSNDNKTINNLIWYYKSIEKSKIRILFEHILNFLIGIKL